MNRINVSTDETGTNLTIENFKVSDTGSYRLVAENYLKKNVTFKLDEGIIFILHLIMMI